MNPGQNNVILLHRRAPKPQAAPTPRTGPLALPAALSEAVALAWELRLQLVEIKGMSTLQRRRTNTLARHIEDRLVYALNHLESQP